MKTIAIGSENPNENMNAIAKLFTKFNWIIPWASTEGYPKGYLVTISEKEWKEFDTILNQVKRLITEENPKAIIKISDKELKYNGAFMKEYFSD